MAMSTLTGCPCFKAGLPSSSNVYRSVSLIKVEKTLEGSHYPGPEGQAFASTGDFFLKYKQMTFKSN